MPNPIIRPPGKIVRPGPDLVQAARALQTTRRGFGTYPYQWIFPGPNATNVDLTQYAPVPTLGTGTDIGVGFQVAEGMRFVLRGVAVGMFGAGFNEGTGETVFDLVVRTSAGDRKVDYYQGLKSHLGTMDAPNPVVGPVQFDSLDTLIWVAANPGTAPSATAVYFSRIVGYQFPLTEALI